MKELTKPISILRGSFFNLEKFNSDFFSTIEFWEIFLVLQKYFNESDIDQYI